jgi:hypothetical protein
VFEIRGIGTREEMYCGYFTNPTTAGQEVAQWANSHAYTGLYVTLNQLHTGVLARKQPNTFGEVRGYPTSSDRDVIKRRWILVDVDAERPAGISASSEEIELSRVVRDCLVGWAREFWDGKIVTAASGNGSHMLLECLQQFSDADVKAFLQQLPNMVDDEKAWKILSMGLCKIDTSVFNPGRITKLYGTYACKGWELPQQDRFFRKSQLEEVHYGYKYRGRDGKVGGFEPAYQTNGSGHTGNGKPETLPGKTFNILH